MVLLGSQRTISLTWPLDTQYQLWCWRIILHSVPPLVLKGTGYLCVTYDASSGMSPLWYRVFIQDAWWYLATTLSTKLFTGPRFQFRNLLPLSLRHSLSETASNLILCDTIFQVVQVLNLLRYLMVYGAILGYLLLFWIRCTLLIPFKGICLVSGFFSPQEVNLSFAALLWLIRWIIQVLLYWSVLALACQLQHFVLVFLSQGLTFSFLSCQSSVVVPISVCMASSHLLLQDPPKDIALPLPYTFTLSLCWNLW